MTQAAKLCDTLGMSVNISCKTGESSVACAAALHVACVIPNIAWGLTLTHGGLAQDVTAQPLPASQSHADALDRPGLGVEVDEDRVRRHCVTLPARHVVLSGERHTAFSKFSRGVADPGNSFRHRGIGMQRRPTIGTIAPCEH